MLFEYSGLWPNFLHKQGSATTRKRIENSENGYSVLYIIVKDQVWCQVISSCWTNLSLSFIDMLRKSFQWTWIYWSKNLWNKQIQVNKLPVERRSSKQKLFTSKILNWLTWTCQFSGSSSFETHSSGSSLGISAEGLRIQEMRSSFIKESSCQWDTLFNFLPNSDHLAAFLQRCSKLVSMSYAAGPSILQCKSCHGCLGPLTPLYHLKEEKRNFIDCLH